MVSSNKTKALPLKVLMVSFDRLVFVKGSRMRERIISQGNLVEGLHVIVYAKRSLKIFPERVAENVWLYPTNSLSRWLYPFGAYNIGRKFKGINLVTAQDPAETGIAGLLLSRYHGSRFEAQIHTDLFSSAFAKLSLLNRLRVVISKFILSRAHCVRVVSEHIKEELEKRVPSLCNHIRVLPVYIDVVALRGVVALNIRKKYPQFDYIVLVVSRLEAEKGVDRVVSAIPLVLKEYPRTALVIVGEGREEQRLRKLACEMGIEKSVIMPGFVNDVASYYKGADVVVNPSDFEGYGRTIVEARMLGIPVISTDVGVAREAGADIVSPSSRAIAERILEYRKNGAPSVPPYQLPYKSMDEYLGLLQSLWKRCGESR